MTGKTHIRLRDLTVSHGTQRILNHISLDIPEKKITAIIGPSGCGKTTLLKSLNRLLDLQEGLNITGQVFIDGEDIYNPQTQTTDVRRRMGLLSQRPQVLPMSIYENVVYGLKIHGLKDKKKLDEAAQRYLKEANLWDEVKDRLHAPAARLSIGQQQRLCLARGLAVEPEIILGDEPTSALDPVSAEQIEQRFLALKNQYTIVLVTHILRQAKRLADYVIFLYMGHLIEHGLAEEVLNNPKYLKTQSYMSGKFIEEPRIDKEITLSATPAPESLAELRAALEGLEVSHVLRVIVPREDLGWEISRFFEQEGHKTIEFKRLDQNLWEILIRKQHVSFMI